MGVISETRRVTKFQHKRSHFRELQLRHNLAYKILDILSDTKKCTGILATITSVSFKVTFRHLTCLGISDLMGVISETRRVTKLQCICLCFYLEQSSRQRDPKYPNTLNV
jgi:hypothetical protein